MEIHAQTLNRLSHQHQIIKHYIDNLPPTAIHNRLYPEKMSIHETIAYLCRYQYIFINRVNKILKEINPFFDLYKPEEDPDYQFTAAKSTGSLLHELHRIRGEMKQKIEKLANGQCARVGIHARMGRMNINQWLEFFLLHESNQLSNIFKMSKDFWAIDHSNFNSVLALPNYQSQFDETGG